MDVVEEKERAMLHYSLRRAALLFRCLLESLAALALLSWSSERLPAAVAHCADLFSHLPAVVLHPLSAFVLGNAIVVTLLAKSGDAHTADDLPSSRCAAAKAATFEAYDHLGCCLYSSSPVPPPPQQLQTKVEEEGPSGLARHQEKRRPEPELGSLQNVVAVWEEEEANNDEEEEEEGAEEEGVGGVVVVMVDDSLEFRQKIEAFITKQLRFIEREEEELLFAEVP